MTKSFRAAALLFAISLLFGSTACASEAVAEAEPLPQQSFASVMPTPGVPMEVIDGDPSISIEDQKKIDLSGYPSDDKEALFWTIEKWIEAGEIDGHNFNERGADRNQGNTGGPGQQVEVLKYIQREYPNTWSLVHPEVMEKAQDGSNEYLQYFSLGNAAQNFRDTPDWETLTITFDRNAPIRYLTPDRVFIEELAFSQHRESEPGAPTPAAVQNEELPAIDVEWVPGYMFVKDNGKWKISNGITRKAVDLGHWQ